MIRSILAVPVEKLSMLNTSMFTIYERNILMELVDILAPFEEATDVAQIESHVNAGFVIPCIVGLKVILDKMHVKYDKKLVDELKNSLNRRMLQYEQNKIYIIASILDPRFRLEWCLSEHEKHQKLEILYEYVKKLSTMIYIPQSTQKDGVKRRKLFEFMDTRLEIPDDSEIESYSRQPTLSDDTDPLQYWKMAQQKFPNLSRIAIDVLSLPASSAAVERIFSIAGKLFRPDRCRLTTKHFEQLMFIRANQGLY